MNFTDKLYNSTTTIWEEWFRHPFIKGIGEGKLAVDKFTFYLLQDAIYLIEYAKVFAIGVIKANDLHVATKLSQTQTSILQVERNLHRSYMKTFGLSDADIQRAQPSCVTVSYTNYMLSKAMSGSLLEVVAVILPCMWGYREIGKHLVENYAHREGNLYKEWIDMYSSDDFTQETFYFIGLMNQLAAGRSKADLAHAEQLFIHTSRFESLFWDMAYYKKEWE